MKGLVRLDRARRLATRTAAEAPAPDLAELTRATAESITGTVVVAPPAGGCCDACPVLAIGHPRSSGGQFMRPIINRAGRDFESEALVVRTDHSDDETWRAVAALLDQPHDEFEVCNHLVDDRGYAGASPDEVVLSAMAADPRLEVVFLADAATMTGDHSPLAVSTRPEELEEGDEELGCAFRLSPALVNEVHVNLAIGHLDFWEFAYGAARVPDKVLRR